MPPRRVLTEREADELREENRQLQVDLDTLRTRVEKFEAANRDIVQAVDHADEAALTDGLAAGIGHSLNSLAPGISALIAATRTLMAFVQHALPDEDDEDDEKPKKAKKLPKTVPIQTKRAQRLVQILEPAIKNAETAAETIKALAEETATVTADAPREPTDVEEKIRQTIALLRERGVRIDLVVQQPLPLVSCVPSAIVQIMQALLMNAIEASPQRDATVTVAAYADTRKINAAARSTLGVTIAIADRGTGMSEEVQRRAFDATYSTKGSQTGRGLGLVRVKRLVRYNDGVISFYSEPGFGTTFEVWLPTGAEA